MTSARIVDPVEVSDEMVRVLAEVLDATEERWRTQVDVLRWYHDEPIWFVIEEAPRGTFYRVLQVTIVRDDGHLWLELAGHRERITDDVLEMPALLQDGVERLPVEGLRPPELEVVAQRVWNGIPGAPDEPGHGGDWERLPLSAMVRKR